MRLASIIFECKKLAEERMDKSSFDALMAKEADYHLNVAKRKGYILMVRNPGQGPVAIETVDGGKTFTLAWGGPGNANTVSGPRAKVKPELVKLLADVNAHLLGP